MFLASIFHPFKYRQCCPGNVGMRNSPNGNTLHTQLPTDYLVTWSSNTQGREWRTEKSPYLKKRSSKFINISYNVHLTLTLFLGSKTISESNGYNTSTNGDNIHFKYKIVLVQRRYWEMNLSQLISAHFTHIHSLHPPKKWGRKTFL